MFTLLDRYILKRLMDYLFLGLVLFTLVLFFSDTLLDFMKDLRHYGISLDIALTLVGLQIPRIVAMVVPMSALLATLMVYNNMNNQFEIIAMRMSGISLYRLAIPALVIGIGCSLFTFGLHDYIVPLCSKYSRGLKTFALDQQNLPGVHDNFTYKQFDQNQQLKRLIYISKFKKKAMGYSTFIDLTNPLTLQVTQARAGHWGHGSIGLDDATVYTVSSNEKLTNTTFAKSLDLTHFIQPQLPAQESKPKELSFFGLWHWLDDQRRQHLIVTPGTLVTLWEKLTIPLSPLPLVLIAVPLSMTSPRRLSNMGFLSAVIILFCYYLIRHLSVEFGENAVLTPILAASMPLILITVSALILFRRKNMVL